MKRHTTILIAAGIGIVNAALLVIFELIGVEMTAWLWHDLLQTEAYPWLNIPVAVVLGGIAMTAVIKITKSTRVISPDHSLIDQAKEYTAPTLTTLYGVLAVGAISLIAGASLGPEASLMTSAVIIGAYAANKWKHATQRQTLILASIGSLLVAFIGSFMLLLIPLILLFQNSKKSGHKVTALPVLAILAAGTTSLITLTIIHTLEHKTGGYGTLPPLPSPAAHDYIVAAVVGFVTAFLALCINLSTKYSWRFASSLVSRPIPGIDWIAGSIFGLVLGTLYFIGGPSVEFSGNAGSHMLMEQSAQLSAAALIGLLLCKAAVTAWSKGTGYRGGTVFPSIYIGVALGLLVGHLFPELGGAGAIIGAICGAITATLGSPVTAGIFLVALLPVEAWPIAACAILGTLAFSQIAKFAKANDKPDVVA